MIGVGDLVVCIDDGPKRGAIGPVVPIHHLIRKGRVYRVVVVGRTRFDKPTIGLAGVTPPPPMIGFSPYRFRKIVPADADFSSTLRPINPPELVPS